MANAAKKKINVVKTRGGVKHVPVGKHKYKISFVCDGRSHTKECSSSTKLGAKRKLGVTKDCSRVEISKLVVATGQWKPIAS